MKKNSSKNVFMAVLVVGLVAIIAIYMMVFQEYSEKTKKLQKENSDLKTEINEMSVHYAKMDVYIKDTAEIRVKMKELMDEYPVDAREEDVVMLAVDMQAVPESDLQYEEINIDESEVLYSIPAEEIVTAKVEGLEETMEPIEFVEKHTTYAGKMDYVTLKKCVQQIYSNPGRIAIHNVAIVKEEVLQDDIVTTNLKGNIDVSFYSMKGTGKEYVAPEMADYNAGTTNPFMLLLESDDKAEGEE